MYQELREGRKLLHVTRKKISKRKGKEQHEGVTGKLRKMASVLTGEHNLLPLLPHSIMPQIFRKLPIKNLGTRGGVSMSRRLHFTSGQSRAT